MITQDQEYIQEIVCIYKEETYSVRDNGAVLRHSRKGKKMRIDDDIWTFGKQNFQNGYMYIGQARIHQIVTTAFHGEPTDKFLVVDHKDSNKCNNRAENLHWVTRLENALNNPTTRWKIEMICGSIEAFLENPSILNEHSTKDPNFTWMRTVSKEEGQHTLKNMENWAKKKQFPTGKGTIGEWIFKKDVETEEWQTSNIQFMPQSDIQQFPLTVEPKIKPSLTPNSMQKEWKTLTEFPFCPSDPNATLEDYFGNLIIGQTFTRNQNSETILIECAKVEDYLIVLSKSNQIDAIKSWYLCHIVKEEQFIHENLGSFFTEEGARKQFTLQQGLEWIGGETIDDAC